MLRQSWYFCEIGFSFLVSGFGLNLFLLVFQRAVELWVLESRLFAQGLS